MSKKSVRTELNKGEKKEVIIILLLAIISFFSYYRSKLISGVIIICVTLYLIFREKILDKLKNRK